MPETEGAIGQSLLEAITSELRKLKAQAEQAMAQVRDDARLRQKLDAEANSLDMLVRHLAGNMRSRWTDFLTTDGEKPTRNRDAEFEAASALTRAELMAAWEQGWACLFTALGGLTPANLHDTVTIRGQELSVLDALLRQFAHYAGHIGQIVFLAKHLEWQHWRSLSLPRKTPGKA